MSTETTAAHGEWRQRAGRNRRDRTRRRLLEAADELFRERGYAATTVTAIAERAGVALQTLYLAWEGKSTLFRAAADAATTASGMPMTPQAWRDVIREQLTSDAGTDPTAQHYLAAVADTFVRVAERTAVYWQMQPAAAASDPDVTIGYAAAMRQRRITIDGVARETPARGLRPGLAATTVADTLWALASPEMYSMFVNQAGKTSAEYQQWLVATLTAALCAEPARTTSDPGRPDLNHQRTVA